MYVTIHYKNNNFPTCNEDKMKIRITLKEKKIHFRRHITLNVASIVKATCEYMDYCSGNRRVQPTRYDVSQFMYFCKTLYMFQTGFPSIISSSKLHIQRQVFVRPLPLPAASLSILAAGSGNDLTLYVQFWAADNGRKSRLKHVQRLTEINKLRKSHLVRCILRIYYRCTDL